MKKILVTTTIISTILLANNEAVIQNRDNPFYPNYLEKDISSAVDVLVRKKIDEINKSKKREGIKNKEVIVTKNQKPKKKKRKTYQKIPTKILIKSLLINGNKNYSLTTQKGNKIEIGDSLYGGIVSDIKNSQIIVKRVEKSIKKTYIINYKIIF